MWQNSDSALRFLPSIDLLLFYVQECFASMYVCTCVPWYLQGQKRVLALLELELQAIVSRHVGAENTTWVLN